MDKCISIKQIAAEVQSGMTLGIGGWGARRKPMAFIRDLLKTDVKDITIVSYGGPDVGMLAATGKIKKLIFGFVSMDLVPLEGHFRVARQSGALEARENDGGMFQLGLKAAAASRPILPTRVRQPASRMSNTPEL